MNELCHRERTKQGKDVGGERKTTVVARQHRAAKAGRDRRQVAIERIVDEGKTHDSAFLNS
jgi:hypothetical protein